MHHTPKRVRTTESGACTYCVKRKERCYIGVKGIPCTTCHRLKLPCDGSVKAQRQPRSKPRVPPPTHCAGATFTITLKNSADTRIEELFASQLQKTELEQNPRFIAPSPEVAATAPLDNYHAIIHQLLGERNEVEPRKVQIPDYVTALPDRLDAADLQYLEAKGALCVPTARFRTELLKSYILWVHPQLPVLDLEPVLSAISKNDGSNTISLLLFHAVMFAGAAFVDISYINQEGYTSRAAAQDILFQRAKVLLELHCEDDRLATVQALLLLVHWHDIQNTEKDASHWIGTCLSLAISIGLHRSPNISSMALHQRQVWKRTWWSLYNHARLTSEDLVTMMTIEGEHHASEAPEVGMIELSDFHLTVIPSEVRAIVDDCEALASIENQTAHAIFFVEKTKLCRLSQFSAFSSCVKSLLFEHDNPETRVCPKLWDFFATRNLEELQFWERHLPSAAQHSFPVSLNPTAWEKSMYLHRTWLRLLYLGTSYAAVMEEMRDMGDPVLFPFVGDYSSMLERYLVSITDLFEEIYSLDLSMFLPGPAVALLVLALAYHRRLVDRQGGKTPRSALKLHQCWNIMQRLQDTSVLAKGMQASLASAAIQDPWERLSMGLLIP
ncbi:fungal-specific transcription factor domain-containing protein [Aspergillus keveii]|uniref:Fungal-specific transcription factor domain-containing protein n=1 Tax=Aspergillus keveii TaxID=714993 RepID=A0ABR4FZB5_9EURO